MSPQLAEVEGLALALPATEREELAQTLLTSLDDAPLTHVDRAWIAVAENRFEELLEGQVEGIPGDNVIDDIRRELGWQR